MPEAASSVERYCLAVITDDTEPLPEIRRHLGSGFRASLATTESEIKTILELSGLHAVLFNLDCIGDGPIDGLEVLEEIRKIRDDIVIVAFTKTNSRSIPLKASQAGADEFFLFRSTMTNLKLFFCAPLKSARWSSKAAASFSRSKVVPPFSASSAPAPPCKRSTRPLRPWRVPMPASFCVARAVSARSSSPTPSSSAAIVRKNPSWPSTARLCRNLSWNRNYSAMKRVPSPVPMPRSPD